MALPLPLSHPVDVVPTVHRYRVDVDMSGMKQKKSLIFAAILLGTLLAIVGCGKQEFDVVSSTVQQKAPGTYSIPPKIDLLLAEDDTGSMKEAFAPIAEQLPRFLSDLHSKGWDYHFAITPLTRDRGASELDEIVAARYDSNWGVDWIPPYPGALRTAIGMVDPDHFRRPEQYSRFLKREQVTNDAGGDEHGFDKIYRTLTTYVAGKGFLRDDALLVILIVGNGNDTPGVNICPRVDGYSQVCSDGSDDTSFALYRDRIRVLKTNLAQIKVFAAVADRSISNCMGGISREGTRYKRLAGAFNGITQDVCAPGSIQGILSSMSSSLQSQRLTFRTRYLFLDREPDPVTIKVIRYPSGDASSPEELLEDPTKQNGWTYEGNVQDVYAIDDPILMNRASGYAIRLYGDARLVGDDTAAVTFKPAGARDSSR